jgi:hypothetical protein
LMVYAGLGEKQVQAGRVLPTTLAGLFFLNDRVARRSFAEVSLSDPTRKGFAR